MTNETKVFLENAHDEAIKDPTFVQIYQYIAETKFDDSIMEIKRFSEQTEDQCPVYFT